MSMSIDQTQLPIDKNPHKMPSYFLDKALHFYYQQNPNNRNYLNSKNKRYHDPCSDRYYEVYDKISGKPNIAQLEEEKHILNTNNHLLHQTNSLNPTNTKIDMPINQTYSTYNSNKFNTVPQNRQNIHKFKNLDTENMDFLFGKKNKNYVTKRFN